MSKINLKNFQLSAVVATAKFSEFAKQFQFYIDARNAYHDYENGKKTFATVELMDPLKELKEKCERKTQQAMNALYRLNTYYKLETDANIVGYIENLDEAMEVLDAIEAFIYQLDAESRAKRASK